MDYQIYMMDKVISVGLIRNSKDMHKMTRTTLLTISLLFIFACSQPEPFDTPGISAKESSNIPINNVANDFNESDEEVYWEEVRTFWLTPDDELTKIIGELDILYNLTNQADPKRRERIREDIDQKGSELTDRYDNKLNEFQNINTPKQCAHVSDNSHEILTTQKTYSNQFYITMEHIRISLLNANQNNDEESIYKYSLIYDVSSSDNEELANSIVDLKEELNFNLITQDCSRKMDDQ